jgi:hypothetical protein
MNIIGLHAAIREERIEWRKHSLQRLAERGILQKDVLEVILAGELIEDYPDDSPYPSALFLAFIIGRPLHVVAAYHESDHRAYIITAYQPSLEFFEENYKTRRIR